MMPYTHAARTTSTTRSHTDRTTDLPQIDDAADIAPADARELSKLFFAQLHTEEEGTAAHQYARNTLIEMNMTLVHFVAGRFRNRGNGELEDIVQVGTIGLIKAIDRFELTRGTPFSSFAIPYIAGEIKRFFRDSTWAVHVPRRLQELRVDLVKAKEELVFQLGREPMDREIAERLDLTEEEVREGVVAANAYIAGPIDVPSVGGRRGRGQEDLVYADVIGDHDHALELIDDLNSLGPLLEKLPERTRRIIEMRFGQDMTQAQIGRELGLSQMQISRLLTGALTTLRKGLLADR